jgi:carbonic anhydrase
MTLQGAAMRSKIVLMTLTSFILSACSISGVHNDKPKAVAAAEATKPLDTPIDVPKAAPETIIEKEETKTEIIADKVTKNEKPDLKLDQKIVSAETSLGWLKHGNIRFIKKAFRADGRSEKDRERLTKGQHPHAIILSCSDSRVPPEIVFDQMLGEIFVIRVLGEALDSSVIASIEYAVEHLHSSLLVVMGHSQCGAVAATVKTAEGKSAGSTDLDKLINDIRPRLATVKNETPSANLEVESTLNADGVARDLVKRSNIIKNAVDQGALVIKSALYRNDSGKVTFY